MLKDVEDALLHHAGISEAVAVAVPDGTGGKTVKASWCPHLVPGSAKLKSWPSPPHDWRTTRDRNRSSSWLNFRGMSARQARQLPQEMEILEQRDGGDDHCAAGHHDRHRNPATPV